MIRAGVRVLGRGALFVMLTLAVAEGGLRLAAGFAPYRAVAVRPGERRILCVGDSHTYGAGVLPEQSYPGQLQRLLDAKAPGTYSVINLGVPGLSTAQVRKRLPANVATFRPDLVFVWCGVNDEWNHAELPVESGWRDRIADWASGLRLYRLVRVWVHDQRLKHDGEVAGVRDGERPYYVMDPPVGTPNSQLIDWGDRVERLRYEPGEKASDAEIEAQATRDFEEMVEFVHQASVPLVFVTYPLELGTFVPANRAIRAVAERFAVPVLDSSGSLARVPKAERIFRWALHPSAPIYREIAQDAADIVARLLEPAARTAPH